MTFENWWEDLELMRRLFRYDSETGLIYAKIDQRKIFTTLAKAVHLLVLRVLPLSTTKNAVASWL